MKQMSDLGTKRENLPRILVMMGTYNGEKYVAQQIESILNQQNVEVHLLISDDGSSDATCGICEGYASRCSNVCFRKNKKNKGTAENFMDMLYEADPLKYSFFAFSDQDDYWLPEKLSAAVDCIKVSGDGPRLYYSDVCNVDANLNNERREYEVFAPYADSFKLLLTVNWASGCTMVFNSAFAEIVSKYKPKEWPRIHDGWMHLVALACGYAVSDLSHSYIQRRITGENQVGERGLGKLGLVRIKEGLKYLCSRSTHFSTRTAGFLLDGYKDYLIDSNKDFLSEYVKAPNSFLLRLRFAFDPGFYSPCKLERIFFRIKMILNKY